MSFTSPRTGRQPAAGNLDPSTIPNLMDLIQKALAQALPGGGRDPRSGLALGRTGTTPDEQAALDFENQARGGANPNTLIPDMITPGGGGQPYPDETGRGLGALGPAGPGMPAAGGGQAPDSLLQQPQALTQDPNAPAGGNYPVLPGGLSGPVPTSPVPGSLMPGGLPDMSSLTGALSKRAGTEGILEQYQNNPEFAVFDILSDAGMDPRRNTYTSAVSNKWGPILGKFSTLAEQLDPTEGAYGRFIQDWAGGGNPKGVLQRAIQGALSDTPEGLGLRGTLSELEPAELARMIGATTGESRMATAARARMLQNARLDTMRRAQSSAQNDEFPDDQRAFLEYLLGQIR